MLGLETTLRPLYVWALNLQEVATAAVVTAVRFTLG